MKNILALFVIVFLFTACGAGSGVQSISLPDVQEIAYKDILSCKKVADASGFSDCNIKHPSGLSVVIRLQTSKIPKAPEPEVK